MQSKVKAKQKYILRQKGGQAQEKAAALMVQRLSAFIVVRRHERGEVSPEKLVLCH
jgi:hypothetical protein